MNYRSGSQLDKSERLGLKLLFHPHISRINNSTANNYPPPPPPSSSSESLTHDIFDSKPSLPAKVCIVCRYYSFEESYAAVFIVDLKSPVNGGGGFVSTAPTLLIDRESLGVDYVFCVMNSTLYMFEDGCWNISGPRGKSVYTYGLSPFLNHDNVSTQPNCTSLELDKRMLSKGTDMLGAKGKPYATPTPDGKRILVFSSYVSFNPLIATEQIDFELYTPAEKSWTQLPSMYDCLKNMKRRRSCFYLKIRAYTFLSKSVFLIHTERHGNFTIDIDLPSLGWKRQKSYVGGFDVPFQGRCFVIEDGLCVSTNAHIYYAGSKGGFTVDKSTSLPKSSFRNDFNYEGPVFRFIGILDDDIGKGEGEFHVVQFQTAINQDTLYAHMILDVCSCNLAKYREDKRREAEKIKIEDQRREAEVEKVKIEDQRREAEAEKVKIEDQRSEEEKIEDHRGEEAGKIEEEKIEGQRGEEAGKIEDQSGEADKIEDQKGEADKIEDQRGERGEAENLVEPSYGAGEGRAPSGRKKIIPLCASRRRIKTVDKRGEDGVGEERASAGRKKTVNRLGCDPLRRRSNVEDKTGVDENVGEGENIVQIESSIVKSLKFVLDGEKCFRFYPLSMFPIY